MKLSHKIIEVFDNHSGELLYIIKSRKALRKNFLVFKNDSKLISVRSSFFTRRNWKYIDRHGNQIGSIKFTWLMGKGILLKLHDLSYYGDRFIRGKFHLKKKDTMQTCFTINRKEKGINNDIIVEDFQVIPKEVIVVLAYIIHERK
jgi:hypothetical protein